jgi:hypothetical protein
MTITIGGTDAPAAAAVPKERLTGRRAMRILLACVLGGLALLPVWRLLDSPVTGLAGAATVRIVDSTGSLLRATLVLLLIPSLLVMRAVPIQRLESAGAAVERGLQTIRPILFAGVLGALAFLAASVFSFLVLQGQPNLVDAMAQLVQARYLAAGHLAGPGSQNGAAWTLQQSLFTPAGWISQYPPGHALLLAAGMKLHAAWAVGPVMLGLTAFFTTLAAVRLLPGRPAVARAGALLVAVSPFLIAHAGAFMNHTTAAALGAMAVYGAVRAESDGNRWLWLAGGALGAMLATRPLSAVTLGLVITVWLATSEPRRMALRTGILALGASPFIIGVAAWNFHFFGSATTFGYQAALGPAGGLGFGIDPWGNAYGIPQAIAWTSADLAALSGYLLETPVPVVALIALWLAFAKRLERGEQLLAGWALLPIATQFAYWHHGLFMGPRMLNESAPAWILLAVIAAVAIVRGLPQKLDDAPAWSPRAFAMTLLGLAAAAGVLVFSPMRLWSYAQRPQAPAVGRAADTPSIIFVHGGWTSRLAMRLAASGMRLDSVESALRQNPTCVVQAWADAQRDGTRAPGLDLVPRASPLPAAAEISPGNQIRVGPGETTLSGECGRQAAADRFGVLDVSPLLWLGDLPGLGDSGRMFLRDLGPAANAALLAAYPRRRAWVLLTPDPGGSPTLVEYREAMKRLWGGSAQGGA